MLFRSIERNNHLTDLLKDFLSLSVIRQALSVKSHKMNFCLVWRNVHTFNVKFTTSNDVRKILRAFVLSFLNSRMWKYNVTHGLAAYRDKQTNIQKYRIEYKFPSHWQNLENVALYNQKSTWFAYSHGCKVRNKFLTIGIFTVNAKKYCCCCCC